MITRSTYLRNLAATGLLTLVLGGCGSSDILSYESDTFFDQAVPTWIIPKLRDDYMGKSYIQPFNEARAIDHDAKGNPVPFPSRWAWPRKGWWPWPLPNPSPGR
jgi:hypothetical protein